MSIPPAVAASWLARNVASIALLESAGRCFSDVRQAVELIERAVNRKPEPKYCGNCPTPLDAAERQKLRELRENDRANCATPLYVDNREDIEITCWRCHQTYNINKLFDDALETSKGLLYSEKEVLDIMAQIGRPIPRSTWWSWKKHDFIENRNEWGAEPKYWLEDAQTLWQDKVGKRKASSAV